MGERHTCFRCTLQTTNEPLAMCDQCDEDVRKSAAQAKAAARAEGYAEGRAAERADMLAFVEDACRLGTQGDALLRALLAKGKHDGAAAIWHSKGYAEAVADVVEMMRDHVRRAENVMRKSHFDRGPFDASTLQAGAYVRGATWALDRIDSGAHVGAAKKGGS